MTSDPIPAAGQPAETGPDIDSNSDSEDRAERRWIRQRFNPRAAVVRLLANAAAIGLVVVVVRGISATTERPWLGLLYVAALFGLLNALVRPALELLLMPFLVQTYGLVVIVISVAIFLLLIWLTPFLHADSVWAVVIGAILLGVLTLVFEGVLGLTPPVVMDSRARPEVRS